MSSLEAKLDKIRSPNLQNQKQVAIVLTALESTLSSTSTPFTPTSYLASLLSLLPTTAANPSLAAPTIYLLDLITPYAPPALLRARFSQILTHLVPAISHPTADAPLLRSSIGVLDALLVAQDSTAWAIPQRDIGPRRALAGLLSLAMDERPKVRKRAQEAVTNILKHPPASPATEHPAADMCATSALSGITALSASAATSTDRKGTAADPRLMHGLQLLRAVCGAAAGFPSRRIDALCAALLAIARSGNEYLVTAALGVFEQCFAGLGGDDTVYHAKLPGVLEAIVELRPGVGDAGVAPAWLAVVARGWEVYAAVDADAAFSGLPALWGVVAGYLEAGARDVRAAAAQCLCVLAAAVIPDRALLDISRSTEGVLAAVAAATGALLSVRFQGAWQEVFNVLAALLDRLQWRADPLLNDAVRTVGELRANEGFQGKKEADEVLGHAVRAMGPEAVLALLPLNLVAPKAGAPGRAWLLPVLREYVANTRLGHFKEVFVPMSEAFFARVVAGEAGGGEKTVEGKIWETLVGQVWALFPGYCDLPLDLCEAFDQPFAELLANVLYQKVDLRADICKGLQALVDTNKAILEQQPAAAQDDEEDIVAQRRVSRADAARNIAHLAAFSPNLLAVLFNVYSTTLPQYRGFILKCLDSFLGITPHAELMATFAKVTTMLEGALAEAQAQAEKPKEKEKQKPATAGGAQDRMPPMAHTLMDLVIAITPYLPADSHHSLFLIFAATANTSTDPQLQKKAYKVVPRLATTAAGRTALQQKSSELQQFLIAAAATATPPARRDRLAALAQTVAFLPDTDLYFIPSVLPEAVLAAKEVNEKARAAAFDLLVLMGERMRAGGTVANRRVPHMPPDAPDAPASLDEYVTMLSAGLAGATPHMISASVTALARVLYQFKDGGISAAVVGEMVGTLDLFLTSKNREVVRSVLGFVKVCVVSLPREMMAPRLATLVPNLMVWSHEHKAHFKAKVKHIIERMIRRFGYDAVERHVPEEDKKLVINIRKTRDRKKRHKEAAGDDEEDEEEKPVSKKRQSKFASEFEEAIYGSDSDSGSDSDADSSTAAPRSSGNKRGKATSTTYIVEDEDEPLDLLDRRSLAHISSTRPQRTRIGERKKTQPQPRTNEDGKLVLGLDDDKNYVEEEKKAEMDVDAGEGAGGGGGVDAYVQAITGRDAPKRGQRNRVKFSNRGRGGKGEGEDEDEEMEVEKEVEKGYSSGGKKGKNGRKGLGVKGVKEGRVAKGGHRRR
ncbi:NUC173 domain-containing protein [Morchella snyderi]|nr:NUC173 domain-containing protein [Morchella snyderi]